MKTLDPAGTLTDRRCSARHPRQPPGALNPFPCNARLAPTPDGGAECPRCGATYSEDSNDE